jgi:UDP-GlcNAc:undecaprenyl-phosphate GlcNAc-1-phosphate transferase
MSAYLHIFMFLSAFIIAFASMPLVIKLAIKIGAVDQPNQRKVHSRLMPRLGGLAIFLAFLLCVLFVLEISGPVLGLILGASIVFLTGVIDDVYEVSPLIKLLGQIAGASVAIYFGIVVEFVTNPFNGLLNLGYLSIPLTLLWIVGISNAINLIDGLDGLAAGVSGIAALTMGIVALLHGQHEVALAAFILVAAILGFLPYNFYPARTFMGDCGSNLLGFILGCLAIMGTAKSAALISLFIPIVILGIPIFDTFFAIIRRINKRAPIFMADKDHLHHRLMAMGMSHRGSVFLIYTISGFFAVTAIALTFITSPQATLVLALLLLLIVLGADKIGLFRGETVNVTLMTENQTPQTARNASVNN